MVVPENHSVNYLLTLGEEFLIVQATEIPSFEVDMIGIYTIHTIVYDPATFNFSDITVGITNVFEANSMLIQGGGCLLYTSPSPRDATLSRMPSSA